MFIAVMNTSYLVLDNLHTNEAGGLPSVLHPILVLPHTLRCTVTSYLSVRTVDQPK